MESNIAKDRRSKYSRRFALIKILRLILLARKFAYLKIHYARRLASQKIFEAICLAKDAMCKVIRLAKDNQGDSP